MGLICNGWEFTPNCSDEFLKGDICPLVEEIRIPHNVKEIPLQYADECSYQMISGYRKLLSIERKPGMRYFVKFEGAAHIAEIFANGTKICEHRCGYTAFTADITDYISDGQCLLAVRLDSTENSSVPPFGFVIDYLTFGGIYRPVWLLERPEVRLEDIFVTTPDLKTVHAEALINGADCAGDCSCLFEIFDKNGKFITYESAAKLTDGRFTCDIPVSGITPWSIDKPELYTLKTTLSCSVGEDTVNTRFGIRTMEFKPEGFYLNGKKTFIRGLNRHQNFPYIGYAATSSLQRFDAEVLKNELHVNAVRTSHYPQSHDFIDACDELGLLVFTEIPGWQHIGDSKEWRDQALENTREMVLQYRNHPSIMLWGVRINESIDCDELYTETNRIAHELDPSRQTSGVRYLEKSHLLEDVYAFNDFSYAGEGIAAKKKSKVSPDKHKALIISESNGHMFPTKAWDTWERREEHALRHAQVMNDAMADGEHVGCFEWCMFDYPTHKDFGSGDRVCYHGVMDYFRNPKLAASFYASQTDDSPVLTVSSAMDIGDYNAGRLEKSYVFTNADKVKLYKNGDFVTELAPSSFKALPHGPLCVDDTIGCLLNTKEGFTGRKEKLLHKALVAAARHGIAGLKLPDLLRMGWCMVRYGLSYKDGVELFGKYVGNWGGEAVVWKFEAIKDGQVMAAKEISPGKKLHLNVKTSSAQLHEGDTYDMALIRAAIYDEYDTPAVYVTAPVFFEVEPDGPIEIVGPKAASLQGGMTGTLIRTTGKTGTAKLTIRTDMTEPVSITFNVTE